MQLLEDIASSTENVSWPFSEKEVNIWDWIPDDEEERNAPVRNLEEWTGISREMLPPESMLNDDMLIRLLNALKELLDEHNWYFILQTDVPERIQYETIRQNFNQEVKVKRWHDGFFQMCTPGTTYGECTLGEYCQCAFFAELFKERGNEDEEDW